MLGKAFDNVAVTPGMVQKSILSTLKRRDCMPTFFESPASGGQKGKAARMDIRSTATLARTVFRLGLELGTSRWKLYTPWP